MKKITSTLMLILIASVLSSGAFAGENLQLMRCTHTVDGVTYDEGGISGNPQTVLSKCIARIDAVHASNPRDTSSPLPSNSILEYPHVPVGSPNKSASIHCDVGVSGSIGNGPYN